MISATRVSRALLLPALLAAAGHSLQASSLQAYHSAPFSQTAGGNGANTGGINAGAPRIVAAAAPDPSTMTFFAAAGGLMMVTIGRRFRGGR